MTRAWPGSLLMLLILSGGSPGIASELCQWTDENGVTHLDDSADQVPARYRSQCKAPPSKIAPQAATQQTANPAPPILTERTPQTALKKFEVPYQNEGSARRVIIPVTLNDSITAPMALDTGAPGMVISIGLAQRLHLFSKGNGNLIVASGGVGGVTPAVLTITDSVSIEGARDVFIPTTVMSGISPAFEGLIGMDFLSGYTVSIDAKRQVVVFQENPADPNARGGHDEAWWRKTFEEFRDARDRWSDYARSLAQTDGIGNGKGLADFQAREAAQLLLKLHAHASDVAVPQEWR